MDPYYKVCKHSKAININEICALYSHAHQKPVMGQGLGGAIVTNTQHSGGKVSMHARFYIYIHIPIPN